MQAAFTMALAFRGSKRAPDRAAPGKDKN